MHRSVIWHWRHQTSFDAVLLFYVYINTRDESRAAWSNRSRTDQPSFSSPCPTEPCFYFSFASSCSRSRPPSGATLHISVSMMNSVKRWFGESQTFCYNCETRVSSDQHLTLKSLENVFLSSCDLIKPKCPTFSGKDDDDEDDEDVYFRLKEFWQNNWKGNRYVSCHFTFSWSLIFHKQMFVPFFLYMSEDINKMNYMTHLYFLYLRVPGFISHFHE